MENFKIVVKTLFGLEEVLTKELHDLGIVNVTPLSRAVEFHGNKELLYQCNLHLRTAIKVLKPIAEFRVRNEHDLYKKIQGINWNKYFDVDQTFAIDGVTSGKLFTHSKYVALKSKDAIVDQFRDRYGRRPSVDIDFPDLRINVMISEDKCFVSLDSSGVPLGKRAYRRLQTLAPISETLAAGIIMLSGWDKQSDFIDPMCGSGTFSIEAAMMACKIAPGFMRKFAFEKWKDFDEELWGKIKTAAEEGRIDCPCKIYASDLDRKSIEKAAENADRAGVGANIHFKKADFLASEANGDSGLIVINPPYGERLQHDDDMIPFYQEIGSRLKHFYNGYDAYIISSNLRALKFIGLKPSKKVKLFNGSLECRLQKYELYRGSKKQKSNTKVE